MDFSLQGNTKKINFNYENYKNISDYLSYGCIFHL